MLTQARLKELLYYDHDTGIFWWLVRRSNRRAGTMAGTISHSSAGYYVNIRISTVPYRAHRLAWLYVTGEWPTQIDHVNNDGLDNRWENLRLAETWQNNANRRMHHHNASGLKGVWRVGRTWRAGIKVNYRTIHLGTFTTKEEAHAAYCAAAKEYFGEFARAE